MPPNKTLSPEEQAVLVNESLTTIQQQTAHMKKCLNQRGKLMDALKHAATLISELRTSKLSPKNYYELYIVVYDSLEYLGNHLREGHPKHHLSDLYELVQYAGNIVPRLYLMITVGTVYMSVSDAPVKEIMKDMIEMCRGVQHPIRGLFLRYYLSQRTKTLLPETSENLQDSVTFIITNFVEMNKLWVRLQHQGHSRERKKRMEERKELQILVGSNLVRLSQLEGMDKFYYKESILPAILEQVVQCRDMLAQEYLLDVIIQVFPDEFHLFTLKEFLDVTINLIPQVSIKKILGTLLYRLTNYVDRETLEGFNSLEIKEKSNSKKNDGEMEKESTKDDEKVAEDRANQNQETDAQNSKAQVNEVKVDEAKSDETKLDEAQSDKAEVEGSKEKTISAESDSQIFDTKPLPAAPDRFEAVDLFKTFFNHFTKLNKVRPDLPIDDITALYYSLSKLSLSFYPTNFDNIDQIFLETRYRYNDLKETVEFSNEATEKNLKNILLLPLRFHKIEALENEKVPFSLNMLLSSKNYQSLLFVQSLKMQLYVSNEILDTLLKNRIQLTSEEELDKILTLLEPIIMGKGTIGTAEDLKVDDYHQNSKKVSGFYPIENDGTTSIEILIKQESLAKLLHLIYNKNAVTNLALLSLAIEKINHVETLKKNLYPSMVFNLLKLSKRFSIKIKKLEIKGTKANVKEYEHCIKSIYQKVAKLIDDLYTQGELELSIKLLIDSASSFNSINRCEFVNELFIKVFVMYEELMSSKQQFQIIMQIITTLITFYKNFHDSSPENKESYDALITKTVLYSARLLKKPDQCRAVFSAAHLWFQSTVLSTVEGSGKYEASADDNKRVLECLQKALRISDSCIETNVSVELFVEILNQCIYYYIHGNLINASYINNLIELIRNNLADVDSVPLNHFNRTLQYLSRQKEIDERFNLITF